MSDDVPVLAVHDIHLPVSPYGERTAQSGPSRAQRGAIIANCVAEDCRTLTFNHLVAIGICRTIRPLKPDSMSHLSAQDASCSLDCMTRTCSKILSIILVVRMISRYGIGTGLSSWIER